MNVLIYNYLQPEDGGGGVGVYSTNLALELQKIGHRVITLSSGDVYAFTSRTPRLRTWRDGHERALIVNSPMIAPAEITFSNLEPYINSSGLKDIPRLLRRKYGSIDVFHFQNLEGLTRLFFEQLRIEFPESRLIYSIHNYNLVCPQVDLWFQDRELCVDYRDGAACTRCMPEPVDTEVLRSSRRRRVVVQALTRNLPQIIKLGKDSKQRIKMWLGKTSARASPEVQPEQDGRKYASFRNANIEICAELFDHILAVSERTRQVVIARGLKPDNINVSYIGTAHKTVFEHSNKIADVGTGLHIAYLGYMRRNKGFHFFIDTLERLPENIARTVTLTVAARRQDGTDGTTIYNRLMAIAPRFRSFHHHNGFTHATLDRVLDGVNLGIVPPIWEDNLPQVAIELVSRGIPILTSDRGGAQEIAGNPDFVFEAGSVESLQRRLQQFSDRSISLARFWDRPIRIYSMVEHVDDLAQYYTPASSPALANTESRLASEPIEGMQ